ncbi:MAG TPA: hypothetical protein EYM81_06300 [Candidatus Poseidoniales archaeon]|nr:hypothetical protein [Candidatus Poseidoniales archaeon]HIB23897.1 hypothetical protein [Candidatus Poseidoniales archaeon]HIB41124.1 hypothetical protein [Candidatus Poseidoniales archaeon]HIN45376.1 hypothetical protein [Candidatus Poseidoniales archaeon]HIO57331.1 hypothetical protein [Candidatus Poseidoniales archaeon]
MIPLGIILCLAGVLMMGGGIAKGAGDLAGLEDFGFAVENATSGTIEIEDNDGEGDFGVTFWVEGEYVDEDENGIWDVCDNINITIIQHPSVNTDWSGDYDGEFYYEVYDSYDGCKADNENQNHDLRDLGYVKVGRACLACYSGTLEFESNASVTVSYDDPFLIQLGEGVGALFVGTIGGTICCGCGGLIAFIGLILGLTLKDNKQPPGYQPPGAMPQQPGYQAPDVRPQQDMGPGYQAPGGMALEPPRYT